MKKAAPSVSIQWPSDWIDVLAIPVATSIMETQPFSIFFLLYALLLTGSSTALPLDALSITLLMLGLHWWARLIRHMAQRDLNDKKAGALQISGLLLALALTIVTHVALLNNVLVLLFVTALVLWFWVRGMRRARVELEEVKVVFTFKLGLLVLLAILLISIALDLSIAGTMLAAFAIALPLFFASGLMVLSFVRLSIARHEFKHDALDRTHAWSLFLTLTWSMLVIIMILLESFSFQFLLTLLTPLINSIDNAVLFIWHLFGQHSSISHIPNPPKPRRDNIYSPYTLPPNFTLNPLIAIAILVIFGAVMLVGIFFIGYVVLQARDTRRDERVQRESLEVRSTLNERRKRNKQRKTKFRLETLNPNSVRACYRDLLLATARHGGDIQRRPHETPAEYQQRLLSVVASLPDKAGEPTNAAIVTELTEAYTLERYGRKDAAQAQVGYFKRWVHYLVKRIKSKKV